MTGTVTGLGWERLAQTVAEGVPPTEIDGVWVFTPLRHDSREWGTAVLSRIDGDRRRIYTARYVLAIKGKERGKFEASVEEVGSGPVEALASLLQEAHARIDDEHPPAPVSPETWFPSLASTASVASTDAVVFTETEAPTDAGVSTEAEVSIETEPSAEAEAPTEAEVSTETEASADTLVSTDAEAPTDTEAPTETEASADVEAPTDAEASTDADVAVESEPTADSDGAAH